MFKLFYYLLLLVSLLQANDKVEIYATSLETKDNLVHADGEVVVIYQDYYLNANRAIYDKSSGLLELFDNVRATHGKDYKILGNYAKLNISKKERTFKPFFMLEKQSNVWLSAKSGCSQDIDIDIESGILSGCNPNNPLWKMEFTSSEYNTEDKWLNLYNTRIYIYDIPVFYTPYFGYSLDKTRRTGLLTPSVGLSSNEGYFYSQSLYIAEQNWWDLELTPQIRTLRGSGIYSTFRFVDTKISTGQLTVGHFREKEEYYKEEELVNNIHYGFNFKYDNSDFINQLFDLSLKGQSAIYADINYMNDVEYINLSVNDATNNATSNQVLSLVNFFYNTETNYFGSYFKHYKDLTQDTNIYTLQKLPTFQYHYYLDSLFKNNVLYSVDIQSNNIYREINKRVVQTDLNIPLTLQTSLFDEYLNISYTAKFYAQHSSFGGEEEVINNLPSEDEYENGLFAREYKSLNISTQLTKVYDEFTHVIGFGSRYTVGGSEVSNGFYEYNQEHCLDLDNKNDSRCEFYNITNIEEEVQMDFTQYIFDSSSKQKIYHRLAQIISYEGNASQVGELENELDYQITDNISLYSNLFYNYDERTFSKTLNMLSYVGNGFNISLSHLYKDDFTEKTEDDSPYTSYVTSMASYNYDEHYSYRMKVDYDLETSLKKSAEVGFLYKKRCWDFGLRYVENNRPALTRSILSDASAVYDRYVYLTLILKPLMQSDGVTNDTALRLPSVLKGQ